MRIDVARAIYALAKQVAQKSFGAKFKAEGRKISLMPIGLGKLHQALEERVLIILHCQPNPIPCAFVTVAPVGWKFRKPEIDSIIRRICDQRK
jgi:hypothetical protein